MLWWTLRKLNSRNAQSRRAAVEELEANRDAGHLAAALSSHRDDVRKLAALALARLGDRRATSELIRMAREPIDYYRSSALKALCKLGDPAGIEAVVEKLGMLDAQDAAVLVSQFGSAVVPYLERVISSLVRPPSGGGMSSWEMAGAIGQRAVDKAAAILDSIGWSPPPGPNQILFLILCGKYDQPSSCDLPYLTELCRRPQCVDVGLKIAEAFQQLQDPRGFEGLALLLEQTSKLPLLGLPDSRTAVWQTAVLALRQISGAECVIPLIKVLTDPASNFRGDAAKALGEIGDSRAVEPLLELFINDHTGYLRYAVGPALGKIRDHRAVEPLIRTLADPQNEARRFAIPALGAIGDARAVEPLVRLLSDHQPQIREAAAKALGEIRDARAVQPLESVINHHDDLSFDVSVAAIESLAKIGSETAVKVVAEALSHKFGGVAGAAARVLAELKDPIAIGPLIAFAKRPQYYGGPPTCAENTIKQLCQLLTLKARESSTEDLNLIVQIGEVRQAEWQETDDDRGYSSTDSYVVDTSHLIELAKQELRRRTT